MSIVAIITARGGSKRIPRKNIKNFCGKPIIAYSIEAAIKSELFDEVMVSTDDNEIASISEHFGAKVPFYRSSETSDDYATTADVINEVISEYKKIGKSFDDICCIYPTAPFITSDTLKNAYMSFRESSANALIPVVKFSYPPQRGYYIKNSMIEVIHDKYTRTRSQDLESIYHDVGQFYFIKTNILVKENSMIVSDTIPFILNELYTQDIDTEDDWKLAEIKFKIINNLK